MNPQVLAIARMIDHSLLHPTLSDADIRKGCETARNLHVAAACVKPCALEEAVAVLKGSDTAAGTVVGFPHGGSPVDIKIREIERACQKGALEIDTVLNIGWILGADWDKVDHEIRSLSEACHGHGAILKCIFETGYLSVSEPKIRLCDLCRKHGVDFAKTSTGYGFVKNPDGSFKATGATMDDLKLLCGHCLPDVKVKAAGGIRTLDQVLAIKELGVSRIGTTSTESLLTEALSRF
jgi:deoxyribose-phosphate aldolase